MVLRLSVRTLLLVYLQMSVITRRSGNGGGCCQKEGAKKPLPARYHSVLIFAFEILLFLLLLWFEVVSSYSFPSFSFQGQTRFSVSSYVRSVVVIRLLLFL